MQLLEDLLLLRDMVEGIAILLTKSASFDVLNIVCSFLDLNENNDDK